MPKIPDPKSKDPDEARREFLRTSVASAVTLGLGSVLSPACGWVRGGEKQERLAELAVLTTDEAAVYDAWCDQLAPGAAEAGVARYLDAQLSVPPAEAFLFLRLFVNPPFEAFYRQGIAGIEQEVQERFGGGSSFVALDETQQRQVIDVAVADQTVAWKSPPPSFFYFVSRADAVDVAFGTRAGFRRLNVPYLAHIRPPAPW